MRTTATGAEEARRKSAEYLAAADAESARISVLMDEAPPVTPTEPPNAVSAREERLAAESARAKREVPPLPELPPKRKRRRRAPRNV